MNFVIRFGSLISRSRRFATMAPGHSTFRRQAIVSLLASPLFAILPVFFAILSVEAQPAAVPPPGAGAAGCQCNARLSVEDAYDAASLIFVGQVTDRGSNPLKQNDKQIKFKVTRKLKGFEEVPGSGDVVIVYTPDTKEKCGLDFAPGLDYLVFADGNPAYYHTSSCSRTDVLDKVLVDVHKLLRLTNNIDPKE